MHSRLSGRYWSFFNFFLSGLVEQEGLRVGGRTEEVIFWDLR